MTQSIQQPMHKMITQVQIFIEQQTNMSLPPFFQAKESSQSTSKSILQQRRIQSAQNYMEARLSGRNEQVLRLVSDDVTLVSSRDGKYVGKNSLKSYISNVKPSGRWSKPTWNRSLNMAEVKGHVKILMITIPVIAQFSFDRRGKISTINVGTRRKFSSDTSK